MKETPTLLLVHGSWHGPWCWEKLTPELDRLGLGWATVSLPSVGSDPARMGTMQDDAAAIETAAAAIDGDVVILAHSYGGVPATEARPGPNLRHIIYLAAFMPDVGGSLVSLLPPGPLPPFVVAHPDGSTSVAPELAVATFYADCDPETAAWAVRRLRLHHARAITAPVSRAAWRELGSTYIATTADPACPVVVQHQVMRQAGATREIAGSHSPFLAQPRALATMLDEIVTAEAGKGLRSVG